MILAIDPGNLESAYCLIDSETYKPIEFGKVNNEELLRMLSSYKIFSVEDTAYGLEVAIEMIASYGMPVGASVFETCIFIGRLIERLRFATNHIENIYRKEEKMNLCNSMKAKDSNIRQALIDRFGVVGTKSSPGWFYGFKSDIWSAYAVGITYLDKMKEAK